MFIEASFVSAAVIFAALTWFECREAALANLAGIALMASSAWPANKDCESAVGTGGPQLVPSGPRQRPSKATTIWLEMVRRLRRSPVVDRLLMAGFRAMQRMGFSVVPNHYYWPIPDLDALEARPRETYGSRISFHLSRQVAFANEVLSARKDECIFPVNTARSDDEYHLNNGMFESVDAEVAHCMVRTLRPRRIIEIGGGYSTRVLSRAARMNAHEGSPCALTTIEPFPSGVLRRGMAGSFNLVEKLIQDVELSFFDQLQPNDILFIDSSHVVGTGSDVVYEHLKIMPRLNKGVVIHLHDIFLPADYPDSTIFRSLCFWSEQYLLEAMLSGNNDFDVLWASSAMQIYHAELLERVVPTWKDSFRSMPTEARRFIPSKDGHRVWPSSFWMRKAVPR